MDEQLLEKSIFFEKLDEFKGSKVRLSRLKESLERKDSQIKLFYSNNELIGINEYELKTKKDVLYSEIDTTMAQLTDEYRKNLLHYVTNLCDLYDKKLTEIKEIGEKIDLEILK